MPPSTITGEQSTNLQSVNVTYYAMLTKRALLVDLCQDCVIRDVLLHMSLDHSDHSILQIYLYTQLLLHDAMLAQYILS